MPKGDGDYKVVSVSKRNVVEKPGDFEAVYITIKNTSDKVWWDGFKSQGLEDQKLMVIEPIIEDEMTTRYFDFSPRKTAAYERLFFRKLGNLHKRGEEEKHIVRPSEKVQLRLYLKAREYTPVDKHEVVVNFRNEKTGHLLKPSNNKPIKVSAVLKTPITYPEINIQTAGNIISEFSNALFDKTEFDTPVVMAVWRRVENLEKTISSVRNQKGVKPGLHLWLNNPELKDQVIDIIRKSDLPIKLFVSEKNVGGYGRFYIARKLVNDFEQVIFIDDDENLADNAFQALLSDSGKKMITGIHAFRMPIDNDYWWRDEVKAGEWVDYIGTGGMACDTSIFREQSVFECPEPYWFMEDLWLCYVARSKLDWSLVKSSATIDIVDDGKDQFRPMIDLKNEFFKYLIKNGFRDNTPAK